MNVWMLLVVFFSMLVGGFISFTWFCWYLSKAFRW